MADLSGLRFNCGCGFTTSDFEEAKRHADNNRHTIDAVGTIKPSTADSEVSAARYALKRKILPDLRH